MTDKFENENLEELDEMDSVELIDLEDEDGIQKPLNLSILLSIKEIPTLLLCHIMKRRSKPAMLMNLLF